MRLLIQHKIEHELRLPLAYHHIIQGIIYHNLKDVYEYSSYLHDKGVSYGERNYKLFTFSLLQGKYSIQNKTIVFLENVAFEISSPDIFLIQTLAKRIHEHGICYGKNHYKDVDVYVSDDTVEQKEIQIQMLSPICVYSSDVLTGKTHYYAPQEEEFQKLINENFFRKYFACYSVVPESEIELRIKKVTNKDKYVTRYKGTYITAYSGTYELFGERKYLDFLYQTGLGSKNSQGFGMFEIIENDELE